MAKDKTKSGVTNKHQHARISYLQQAATYLTRHGTDTSRQSNEDLKTSKPPQNDSIEKVNQRPSAPTLRKEEDLKTTACQTGLNRPAGGQAHLLTNHLTQVARKSQIRLHPSIKHQICKRCHATLFEGLTCRKYNENLSRGGKKAHADVLVVECSACGAKKRWPVGAKRQMKKGVREAVRATGTGEGEVGEGGGANETRPDGEKH